MHRILLIFVTISFLMLAGCKLQPKQTTLKLHKAVLAGRGNAVVKYLKKGAFINNQENERGWTPLLFATEAEDVEIVKILIDHGAGVNTTSTKDKVSPLQRAASRGNLEIVKILMADGAKVNYQDAKLRSTPLMWAAANGHFEVALFLLENGALINVRGNRGESALFLAVLAEEVELVKLLLSFNAIRDRPDIYGKTPLEKATELKNQEIINLLNSNGS